MQMRRWSLYSVERYAWTLYWYENLFAFDCDFVSTSGILVALKQKKKEVNKLKIICYYDIIPMRSFGVQFSLNFTQISFS